MSIFDSNKVEPVRKTVDVGNKRPKNLVIGKFENLLVSEKPEKKDDYHQKRRRRVGFACNFRKKFAHIRIKKTLNSLFKIIYN